MEQNPYESPKKVDSRPTVKAGIALGMLLLLSIPAGCIAGSVTCYAVGESGMLIPKRSDWPTLDGFLRAIPIGLLVVVLIPTLAVLFLGKRKNRS
jgi:hypothetical protein